MEEPAITAVMSPCQRSLKKLRSDGWTCAITEHWNPYSKTRSDLFGFCDILCFKDEVTLAVQTTSGDNVSHRLEKIMGIPAAKAWATGSIFRQITIHGWRKVGPRGKRKVWECREVPVEFI